VDTWVAGGSGTIGCSGGVKTIEIVILFSSGRDSIFCKIKETGLPSLSDEED
jgi:hypothetical protein